MTVPDGYYKKFLRAERTFRHQRVFDPRNNIMVPWNPIPDELLETDTEIVNYIGPYLIKSRLNLMPLVNLNGNWFNKSQSVKWIQLHTSFLHDSMTIKRMKKIRYFKIQMFG